VLEIVHSAKRFAWLRPHPNVLRRLEVNSAEFWFTVDRPAGSYIVLRLAGEIDMVTVPDVRACLVEQLAAQPQHLVIDLGGVTFFGSRALALLVEVKQMADSCGTKLYLAPTNHRPVARVLEVSGVGALFGDEPPPPDLADP